MDWNIIYKKYIERNPNCFHENNYIKLKQKFLAMFTAHFIEEWGWFKEEIREISLDNIYELYFKACNRFKHIKDNIIFEEYIDIFKNIERKTNSNKKITYKII